MHNNTHVMSAEAAEFEQLRLEARVWEPEAEIMLDHIGIQQGWHTVDLGCGGMGILGPLSRRVGPNGLVVGVDCDPKALAAARDFLKLERLGNVEITERDAYHTRLSRESYDLTHARFLFSAVGHDEDLLKEIVALTRPGGVVALQEPDGASWNCYPGETAYAELMNAVKITLHKAGGDFNAGRKLYGLLRAAGIRNIQMRAAALALPGGHPYMRLPILFAEALRMRIISGGILSQEELDRAIADCETIAADPGNFMLSFTLLQIWGRKDK
jgi:ubiquinone/menaquinone biosynthesis C-methylase UbiE